MKKTILFSFVCVAALLGVCGFVFSEAFIARCPLNFSISPHYYVHPLTKEVYFIKNGDWRKHDAHVLNGVRASEFKLDGEWNGRFGTALVYGESIFPQINAEHATFLPEKKAVYIKDRQSVYYVEHSPTTIYKLEGADPKSFELIGDSRFLFAKDKKKIYKRRKSVKLHGESVEILDNELYKNENHLVFFPTKEPFEVQEITLAGPSFKPVGFGYFDGKSIYFIDYKENKIVAVEVKNPESVRADANAIVYDGTKLIPTASSSLQER